MWRSGGYPVSGRAGRVLDDGLCTLFPAPHSFTGEDVAEISCHGGVPVTRSVLDACLRAGARQALPGEFTRRAFPNGRLSLDEAEALGNLLEAGSDEQLRLSRAGMSGHPRARPRQFTAPCVRCWRILRRALTSRRKIRQS